ncbi:MAG: terpene cyclase/mutase family protein, partial [Clostridia bacterium]|nr:terpene cyclase/mutase family protein [Clostridia bacterium]
MKRKISCTVCAIIFCITTLLGVQIRTPLSAFASEQKTPYNVALEIIDWKKSDVGSTSDGYLINDTFLTQAGTTPGDWYPIGLGRLGIKDNQEGYLAVINDNVQKRYQTSAKLDKAKATEWHRISLAVLASGGNPRRMGENGEIDLIADGIYNRVDGKGNGILGKQGINGFIWGLIAIDSMQYEVPENAYYSRDDMILNILNRQLADGGWALTGNVSDPDMTSMAIQALAPYYNSEKEYIYENKKLQADGSKITKKVRTVVDEAISWLSLAQNTDGGYSSWGTENCESAVQVAVALCALGIDIFTDIRFIKDGNTIYDAILSYQNADGGFLHSLQYDPENPSSLPDKSNTMASEQTLYGMVAIHRYQNGMRRLFDFRQEQSEALKSQIAQVETQIQTINE